MIAVTKDNIEMLTEVDPSDVELITKEEGDTAVSFLDVLKNIKKNK